MSETIQKSAEYLEAESKRNCVALRFDIEEGAPALSHDDLYLFRIVQNLVGNAVNAVKETIPDDWQDHFGDETDGVLGEIFVRYHFSDGEHVLEVTDSGPGMTRETAEKILAGTARSQWDKGSGSGWGTKIVLELAATHRAKVSIESEIGHGSTFRVVFPHDPSQLP